MIGRPVARASPPAKKNSARVKRSASGRDSSSEANAAAERIKMSKRTTITTFCSFFVLTTLPMGLGGCDDGDITDAEREEASADLDLEDAAPAREGALRRIGAEFKVLDVAGLGGRAMSAEEARELVAGADGLGLDLRAVDSAALAGWKPLSDAAMELGVPLIIEHVDDSEMLAELIGVGVEADVAMVTTLGPNRYRVRVYGGGGGEAFFEGEDDEPVVPRWSADTISLAVDEIGEALRKGPALALTQATHATQATPATGYRYYDFDMAEESFSPVSGQTSSLSMDFEAELVLDPARGKKNVFFRPIGSGQHPGSLISDGSTNRGYYQESQEITIEPNSSSVSLYAHAPDTENSGSTYTSSTGWAIGVSGSNPELSYSESNETSITLPDFSMVNNTSGATASWRFAMSKSWSDMFKHDAFEKCEVKSLPNLAKSNLAPEFEVLYRADESFSSNVTFDFTKVTLLRRIWRGGDIFTCKKNSNLWTVPRDRTVTIHFGSI